MQVRDDERMLPWLGKAAAAYRKESGAVRSQIAGLIAADQGTVRHFEIADGWPTKVGIDEMLTAYVQVCGLDSTQEIWRRALQTWAKATSKKGR